MSETTELLPVPRSRILVTRDGLFVVQWEQNSVQDLLTGKYHSYSEAQFGSYIADWELSQLRAKGIVERYDQEFVYLASMLDSAAHTTTRSFYLNTSLPKSAARDIEALLIENDLQDRFSVRATQHYLAIRGRNGVGFTDYNDAERARELLVARLPETFYDAIVAFVEMTNPNHL